MKIIKKIKKASMSKSKKDKKSVAKKIDKKILKALKERYLKAKKDKKEAKAAYKMAKSFFEKNKPVKKTKVKAKAKAKVKATVKVKKTRVEPTPSIAKPRIVKPKSNATVTTLSELKPTPSKVAKKLPKPLRIKKAKPALTKEKPVAKKVTPKKRVTVKKATPNVAPKSNSKPVAKSTPKPAPKPKAVPKISKRQMEDLKVVEGIGPAIEKILKSNEIKTLADLSKARVATLRNILTEAGNRFRFHKPDTWARQARLAAAGRWKELEELQQRLDGGKKK